MKIQNLTDSQLSINFQSQSISVDPKSTSDQILLHPKELKLLLATYGPESIQLHITEVEYRTVYDGVVDLTGYRTDNEGLLEKENEFLEASGLRDEEKSISISDVEVIKTEGDNLAHSELTSDEPKLNRTFTHYLTKNEVDELVNECKEVHNSEVTKEDVSNILKAWDWGVEYLDHALFSVDLVGIKIIDSKA